MAHDVFISYASADQTVAQMVCATLEKQGIRCWMAPRDVQPGDDWGSAIVAAIKASRAMVLVFSGAANDSRHIPREVERAIGREIPLVPVRIENVEPSGSLEYSLSSVHWLDAISPPVEAHIVKLAERLRTMIDRPVPGQPVPPVPVPPTPAPSAPVPVAAIDEPPVVAHIPAPPLTPAPKAGTRSLSWRGLLLATASIAGIVVLAIVLSNQKSPGLTPSPQSSPSPTVSPAALPTSTPTPDPPATTRPSAREPAARTPQARPAPTSGPPPPPRGSSGGTLRPEPKMEWLAYPTHRVDRAPTDPRYIEQLQRTASASPMDDRPLIKLGDIFYDARQYGPAIDSYSRALAIRPNNSPIRIDLAMAYWHSTHYAEARSHLLRVLDLEPRNARAILNLGAVYARANDLPAASHCWQDVIENYSGTWEAARAREMMAKLRAR